MATHYKQVTQGQLSKDIVHKKISGVCAGIARRYKLPRIAVRAATVISFLYFPLAILIAYIAAAVVLPTRAI